MPVSCTLLEIDETRKLLKAPLDSIEPQIRTKHFNTVSFRRVFVSSLVSVRMPSGSRYRQQGHHEPMFVYPDILHSIHVSLN
jgi:hypothetical protein